MAFMPHKAFSQNRIACDAPIQCNGWLYHVNKIGIGSGWGELYTPRTTLHLHEFNSTNTYLNITNQTTGFPSGNQTLGMFVGMTGNKATISNFQNDNLVLATGTTERLIVTPTGNIGVGISTPQNLVHIHNKVGTIPTLKEEENKSLLATSVYGIQITNLNTGTSSSSGLLIGLLGNGNARIVQQRNYNLSLGVNNTDVITINSSKNVGIGTTTPTAKLHTKGTLRFESLATDTAFQNQKVLITDATGNVSQIPANLIGDNLGNHTASQNIKMNDQWLSNDGDAEGIKVSNHGDVFISGNLGVGVATPLAKVHIASSANNGACMLIGNNPYEGEGLALMDVCNQEHSWIRGEIGHGYQPTTSGWQITGEYNYGGIRFGGNGIRFVAGTPADATPKEVAIITNEGDFRINDGIKQINIGNSYSNAPYYLSSYLGFNAQRNSQGQWLFASDGANNGGSAFINDVAGNLRIVTYKPTQGTTTATLSEAEFLTNTSLLITSTKKIGLRTTYLDANADVQIKGSTYVEDQLGIGICLSANNNPKGYRLAVNGTIGAKDIYIEIDETPWPDYVFEPEHKLMPLSDMERYIHNHKHLPDIPSAKEIKENGLSLAEINALLVKKVEELTLYIIELNKKIEKYETSMIR